MTDLHLTLRATVGDDGRYMIRDDTGKVVFTCQPGQSYEVPADRTLAFPHRLAKVQAEAALAQHGATRHAIADAAQLLRLVRTAYVDELIPLDEGGYIAQVRDTKAVSEWRCTWRVVVDGRVHHEAYPSRDMALLAYLDLANGGNGYAAKYAARVIGMKTEG